MSVYRNIILLSGSILTAFLLTQYPSLLPFDIGSLVWTPTGDQSIAWAQTIKADLGQQLSNNASILTRRNGQAFRDATIRWQELAPPSFAASVHVYTENDVQQVVRYANSRNISFLATSGKHGDNAALAKLKDGIQIDMRGMAEVTVDPTSDFATVGGGILDKQLIESLLAAGKRTTTGVCDCVGYGGLAMGGGHGFLQGQYGLVSDQVISARVVLANGEVVTASRDENPDLFWALRGAGHNFGVVTEFKSKVYPAAGHEDWTVQTFVFPGSQLEDVFAVANKLALTQPATVVHMSMFILNPAVDPVQPVIVWIVFFDGPEADLEKHTGTLFKDLQPIDSTSQVVPYTALPAFILSSEKDPGCDKAIGVFRRFPVDFHTPYNIKTMRKTYDLMTATLQATPEFAGTWIAIEQYSCHAVEAVPASESAFGFRKDNILIAPFVYYMPNSTLDAKATEFGEGLRSILQEGTGKAHADLHAYVNYANGLEPKGMANWYSSDERTLKKLRSLKQKYDPERRFSFYAPIE